MEHVEPWLDSDNPIIKFYDLDNIKFSHLSCNSKAGRKQSAKHGTSRRYNKGCKCSDCKKANTIKIANYRQRKNQKLGPHSLMDRESISLRS